MLFAQPQGLFPGVGHQWSVASDKQRARGELEGGSRRELRTALVELVRQHLAQALGTDSFAWFGAARGDLQACWTLVLEMRGEYAWLPALPAPELPVPAPLGLVQHQPGTCGDGDREHDERKSYRPRNDEKQDEADDDPGDS